MLSDIIAPGRLRAGDPQALAALVAVGGWPVVAYCERAGAGDHTARAVVLTFVSFRRRAIQAGDGAGGDLERILLESARDAVDDVRGEEPADAQARGAEEVFARASPRPLSPRLATHTLHALVDAAPVDGDPAQVRAAAERAYAAAYDAAEPAPATAGEQELAAASTLLLRATQRPPPPVPAPVAQAPQPAPASAQRAAASAPLAARLRALPPDRRAVAFAGALVAVVLLVALLGGRDAPAPSATTVTAPPRTVTVTQTATAPDPAPSRQAAVIRSTPRTPFSASGARFEVVPISDSPWAREVRGEQPRRGTRWVTVAVRTRNVSRRDLVLRTLGYRLRAEGGTIVGPRVLDVAEGPERARAGRLPVGARASVHLGFEVPFETGRLSVAFEPGGLDGPTALVPIGRP